MKKKAEIKRWIIDWFKKNGLDNIPIETDDDIDEVNYFEAGWIDSFGVIGFIEEIESHFNIRFSADNFRDRRFFKIKGLVELIYELLKEKG